MKNLLKISNWKIDIFGLKSPFSSMPIFRVGNFSIFRADIKVYLNRGKGQVAELMRNSS